jgi:glycosyltransferase involved in cell wall biosynthesis
MAKSSSKIAIVVQRFGASIIGGAETHARLVAEQLHKRAGLDVEVYTTTSRDYGTWDDSLPEGTSAESGLMVHRFRPRRRRGVSFKIINALLKLGWEWAPSPLRAYLEGLWIRRQGPYVPQLIEALVQRQEQYAGVIFFTYLYYPTLIGLPRVSRPKILVPTAHDERPFYLRQVRKLLAAADLVFANTAAEASLIQRAHGVDPSKLKVVGVGLERPSTIRKAELMEGAPLRLLYMGRVGPAKAVDQLVDFFTRALAAHPSLAATLRLVGPLEASYQPPTHHPHIQYLGVVTEEQKSEELRSADIVINPSHHESLSLLVLEGIVAHKLILVQKDSAVLRDYAERYATVLSYGTAEELAQGLMAARRRMSDPTALRRDLAVSASDVEAAYGWEAIVNMFTSGLSSLQKSKSQDEPPDKSHT